MNATTKEETTLDTIIAEYLALDLEVAEAECPLPSPPIVPRFACETVRPGKLN